MKYPKITNGEELDVPSTWIVGCCDCGLVHRFEFRCKKDGKGSYRFVVKVFREERRTAAKRRHNKDYPCKLRRKK